MDAIVQFFENIGNAIIAGFSYLISIVQDTVYVVQLLGQIVVSIPSYFSWIPPEISGLLVILFSLVVLYKVLGREG